LSLSSAELLDTVAHYGNHITKKTNHFVKDDYS